MQPRDVRVQRSATAAQHLSLYCGRVRRRPTMAPSRMTAVCADGIHAALLLSETLLKKKAMVSSTAAFSNQNVRSFNAVSQPSVGTDFDWYCTKNEKRGTVPRRWGVGKVDKP